MTAGFILAPVIAGSIPEPVTADFILAPVTAGSIPEPVTADFIPVLIPVRLQGGKIRDQCKNYDGRK